MKRTLVGAFALAGALTLVLAVGFTRPASASPGGSSLTGTGSTFVYPLISKWIPALAAAYGIDVTYSPTGSGAGIALVAAGWSVDGKRILPRRTPPGSGE